MQNGRILQLDPVLANQIAAGEVVERPASVVKELLENSIDAGATQIEIEIEGAGMHLIRLRDNGRGIMQADLALAFARHATSKIHTVEDLSAIGSLGFRGEALASISSVARCRLMSRSEDATEAWQISIAPDLTPSLSPVAHPIGTTIEVADLFYNTPVRRRFLRSEKTEFQAIDEVVKRIALGYPHIRFVLTHQERQIRFFPAQEKEVQKNRIAKVCGQAFVDQAIYINMQVGSLHLQGWLGLPTLGYKQAQCQYFFVNNRIIKDRILNHAIKTLYEQHPEYIPGSYPGYVLYLACDLQEVDVNVHPTKQEVRFSQPRLVHDFLKKCVEEALTYSDPEPCEAELCEPVYCHPERSEGSHQPRSHKTTAPLRAPLAPLYALLEESAAESNTTVSVFQKRYSFIEDTQGITIVDMVLSKEALLVFYFLKYADKVLTKKHLFPTPILLSTSQISQAPKWLSYLSMLGIHVKIENKKQLFILEQPIIINDSLAEFILSINIEEQNTEKLCKKLAAFLPVETLANIPSSELTLLLPEWMAQAQQKTWVILSHSQIAALR